MICLLVTTAACFGGSVVGFKDETTVMRGTCFGTSYLAILDLVTTHSGVATLTHL
jgi:hypothetical protein